MASIKHVLFYNIACEPDDLVHTHSITSGESTINPASCSMVSARLLSAVFSKYVQRILSRNVVLLQAESSRIKGLEVKVTCSTLYLHPASLRMFSFLYRISKSKYLKNPDWHLSFNIWRNLESEWIWKYISLDVILMLNLTFIDITEITWSTMTHYMIKQINWKTHS